MNRANTGAETNGSRTAMRSARGGIGLAGVIALAAQAGCSGEPKESENVGSVTNQLSTGLVIAEVYGGGNNLGAAYTHDFVTIFNRGTTPVSTGGVWLQFTAATNPFSNTNQLTPLGAVTLNPGQYYLVQLAAAAPTDAGAQGVALPTPDHTGSFGMNPNMGKLVLTTTPLNGCGTPDAGACALTNVIDLLGYGAASQFETAPAAGPTGNAQSTRRKGGGCIETDNNSTDFEIGNPPTPKNTASTASPCAVADAGSDAVTDATVGDAAETGADAATGGSGGTGGTDAAAGGTAGTDAAAGGTAGTDAAAGGTGGGTAGTGGGTAGTGGGTGGSGTGGSGTGGGGTGGTGGGTGGAKTGGAGGKLDGGLGGKKSSGSDDDGGCGCETPGSAQAPRSTALLLLLGLALLGRRSVNRSKRVALKP